MHVAICTFVLWYRYLFSLCIIHPHCRMNFDRANIVDVYVYNNILAKFLFQYFFNISMQMHFDHDVRYIYLLYWYYKSIVQNLSYLYFFVSFLFLHILFLWIWRTQITSTFFYELAVNFYNFYQKLDEHAQNFVIVYSYYIILDAIDYTSVKF